jgi:hypothetical protein
MRSAAADTAVIGAVDMTLSIQLNSIEASPPKSDVSDFGHR